MTENIDMNAAYMPSDQIVAREISGKIILVPITAGVGDMEDELFTLNETGKVIWGALSNERPLKRIVRNLADRYDAPENEITSDVVGLLGELLRRNMVVKVDSK